MSVLEAQATWRRYSPRTKAMSTVSNRPLLCPAQAAPYRRVRGP
jgi:hypothetical protein